MKLVYNLGLRLAKSTGSCTVEEAKSDLPIPGVEFFVCPPEKD